MLLFSILSNYIKICAFCMIALISTSCISTNQALQRQINVLRLENSHLRSDLKERFEEISSDISKLNLHYSHTLVIRSSVILVSMDDKGNSFFGSGWITQGRTGKKVIVTNRHVVNNWPNRIGVVCFFPGTSEDDCELAKVEFVSGTSDIAIVAIDWKDKHKQFLPLKLSNESSSYGDSIIVAGHPFPLLFQSPRGVITGTSSPYGKDVCGLSSCHVVDIYALPGMSGGPVVNSDGLIVGMITMNMLSNAELEIGSSFSFIVPLHAIRDSLSRF